MNSIHPSVTNSLPTCFICDAQDWQVLPDHTNRWLIREPGLIYECQTCGARIVRPVPSDEINHDTFNDPDYYSKIVGEKTNHFRERVRLIQSLTRPDQRYLLDVGCARGDMLLIAREAGFEVEGIEFSDYAATYAAREYGLKVSKTPLQQIASTVYDVVHANHVLEHVDDPLGFAQHLHRVLKEGGWCVIEVPNEFANLMYRLNEWLGHPRNRVTPSIHLVFFDPKTLKQLMINAGFNNVRISTHSPKLMVSGRLFQQQPGRLVRSLIREFADRTNQGSNLVCVCQK